MIQSEVVRPHPIMLQAGKIIYRALSNDPEQQYFLYLPKRRGAAGAPLLVTVHGISRNAREQVARFAMFAERYGVVIAAPLFSERGNHDYQRLGRRDRGPRADRALERIVDEVERLTGARTGRFHLFGYSGGGQFAHRYAMAHPERVAGAVIAAAGWYTFPDETRRYPHGVRSSSELPGVCFDPEKFLRVPIAVLVGERDVERDAGLRKSKGLDRRQGTDRVQRGKRWVQAMTVAARSLGLDTSYTFELLPDSDHSFERSMDRGRLAERAFEHLFGPPSAVGGRVGRLCAVHAKEERFAEIGPLSMAGG